MDLRGYPWRRSSNRWIFGGKNMDQMVAGYGWIWLDKWMKHGFLWWISDVQNCCSFHCLQSPTLVPLCSTRSGLWCLRCSILHKAGLEMGGRRMGKSFGKRHVKRHVGHHVPLLACYQTRINLISSRFPFKIRSLFQIFTTVVEDF